jgi:hypothetical protein
VESKQFFLYSIIKMPFLAFDHQPRNRQSPAGIQAAHHQDQTATVNSVFGVVAGAASESSFQRHLSIHY